jgi:phage regulator Rha-like protein
MTALALVEKHGESRVDTRTLAQGLRNQHKNVLELIERYKDTFERFGKVAFQTEPLASGQRERYALLNEDQSYFLLSLSRNTDHVVDLKANLVLAFKEARAGQALVAIEYLPGYHELHDKAHELANGSPNERFVHMNLNKLVNKAVGISSGQRSTIPAPVRSLTVVAQTLAARAMAGTKDHHDGYERAKTALTALGTALTVGST